MASRIFSKGKKNHLLHYVLHKESNHLLIKTSPSILSFDNFNHSSFLWHVYKVTLKHIFNDSKNTSPRESISSQQHQHSHHNTSKQCLKYFLHQKWHLLTKKHLVPSFQLPFQWWFSKDNSKRHSSIHFTCVDWFVIILPTSSNHRFSMFELPPTSTHSNTTIHVLSQDDHIESSFLIQITSKSFSIIPKQQMQAHLMKHVSLNSFTCIAQLSRPQIVSISVVLFW